MDPFGAASCWTNSLGKIDSQDRLNLRLTNRLQQSNAYEEVGTNDGVPTALRQLNPIGAKHLLAGPQHR